jgi:3-oxoacyl-[acyl-carrier protein] reductase
MAFMLRRKVMKLKGSIAIVTGAGQGIGKAIALCFAKHGAVPIVVDLNEDTSKQVVKEIEQLGIQTIYIKLDVSDVPSIRRMVKTVVQEFGTINILVNNAGIVHGTSIEDITENEWDRMLAVNLKGAFFTSQQVLPYMKEKRHGRIINISSNAGRMGGYANGLAYSASKAGIIGLTMGFARRVAEYNITVNAVAPGTTETDIIKQLPADKIEKVKELIPLKRMGKPEEIAEVVIFLASEGAGFMTGAVLDVNGGMFMG